MQWQINPRVNTAQEDDEVVLLHLSTGQFFGLDPVGSRIWALLRRPASLEDLVTVVSQEFMADEGRVREDVLSLLASLEHHQLVIRA